jgi:hypothetical protein
LLYHALVVGDPPDDHTTVETEPGRTPDPQPAFRLQVNVRRGNGSNLPGAGSRYAALDDARDAARELLRDDRVLQVTVVADAVPPRFVEWVNR